MWVGHSEFEPCSNLLGTTKRHAVETYAPASGGGGLWATGSGPQLHYTYHETAQIIGQQGKRRNERLGNES